MMDNTKRPAPLFGISITPSARNVEQALSLAQVADQAGLDLIGIQDHPYNSAFLDTWTLLAVIGGQTRQIRLLPDVMNLPLRPPAMLAKAAASLDLLTGGRVEMGLGAGGFWDGVAAYGGPRRAPGEAVAALREAIELMRRLWRAPAGQEVGYSGRYYSLEGAQAGPPPAHEIGVWLGALGPKMLRLTGELADGWIISVGYVPPDEARQSARVIDEAADAAGRRPSEIRRAYNVGGVLLRPEQSNVRPARPGVLVGPAARWVDQLAAYYHEVGMDTFIFWPAGGDDERQVRAFAEEVVPAAREAIGGS